MQREFWRRAAGSAGVVSGVLLLSASAEVRAGVWEVVPNSNYFPNNDNLTLELWSQLRQGVTEDHVTSGLAPNETTMQPFRSRLWENPTQGGFGWDPSYNHSSTYSSGSWAGGLSYHRLAGTAKTLLRWKPNPGDPNDKPPMFLSLFIETSASGSAYTYLPTDGGTGASHDSVHANAAASVEASNGSLIDWSQVATAPERKSTDYYSGRPVAIASASEKGKYFRLIRIPDGTTKFLVPTAALKSYGQADRGRASTTTGGYYGSYSTALHGNATASVFYNGLPIKTTFTPDPARLAVENRAFPGKLLNQQVIDGHPFAIPCSASFLESGWNPHQEIIDKLSKGFSWRLIYPPAPISELPRAQNVVSTDGGITVSAAFIDNVSPSPRGSSSRMGSPYPTGSPSPTDSPSPTPDPSPTGYPYPTPVPSPTGYPWPTAEPSPTAVSTSPLGLGFNATVMPSENTEFGEKTVEHLFNDTPGDPFSFPRVIATAPIALFYKATAETHPYGGPKGYYVGENWTWAEIDTPNWLYYYNQAWPAPCTIQYALPIDATTYGQYIPDEPFIRLYRAHGDWVTAIFRKGFDGKLAFIGHEKVKGIDTYARVIAHENAHKRCREAIVGGMLDTDGDKVPDDWERAVGLTVSPGIVKDTTGIAASLGGTYTAAQGDSEAFARLYEESVDPPVGADWADDGLNRGIAVPGVPHVTQRWIRYDRAMQPVNIFPSPRVIGP